MNRQAVDMWTMRFAHRQHAVDSAVALPTARAFAPMTTAFHHV